MPPVPDRGLLRLATPADVEALFAVRTAVRDNPLTVEQLAELGITPQTVAAALAAEACGWVLVVDDAVVGFSMVDLEHGELFALFVRPEWQGHGFGHRLLAAAEAALFRRHALIWLVTDGRPAVRANAFYLAHGWHRVASLEGTDVRYEKSRPLEQDAGGIS